MTLQFLQPVPSDDAVTTGGALARYEDACRALAEALTVDAAKGIADWSDAMRVYARQAKNRTLEIDAAEIRIRAERRIGELIASQKVGVGLHAGGRPKTRHDGGQVLARATLAEAGIDRNLSSRAQRLAAIPVKAFADRMETWRTGAERDGARVTTRLVHDADKKVARAVREEILGRRQRALPDKRYGVIYADPEWRFEVRSRETGLDRSADNHYPTSATEIIGARPVASIAAPDCVLFLWATAPMIREALTVMAEWGFDYRSHVVWRKAEGPAAKVVLGTGYIFRNAHELLLYGVRGSPPAPAPGTQFASIIDAPPRKHSEKPEVFAEMIEQYFPTLPRIELNARRARPGWDAWGLEAPDNQEVAK